MLTDEQIDSITDAHWGETAKYLHAAYRAYGRAIEAAACADRDARIAELEQRNSDLHEDVQRFKEHALNEKAARLELEHQLEEARKDAERWRTFLSTRPQSTHEVIIQAIDDAAMRKGKS